MRRLLTILFYYLGVDWLFYWLNRKSKRVLTFHHVIPSEILPSSEASCICFSDVVFKRILDIVGSRFHFSNDLTDISTCTITFDDGYLNQFEIAGKILRQQNIPAVLFLTSALENSQRALVVDRHLLWAHCVPMDIAEMFFGRAFESREQLWTQAVRPMFAKDAENRGEESWRRLEEAWEWDNVRNELVPDYFRLRTEGISTEQLEELRNAGWLICHHTQTHFPVSELDEDDARKEIIPPQTSLPNGMCKLPFSFPYGDLGSVSEKDVRVVEDVGFPYAFANGVNKTSLTGRFFYPRFMFCSADKYEIHFQLSGLKYFLQNFCLLPRLR